MPNYNKLKKSDLVSALNVLECKLEELKAKLVEEEGNTKRVTQDRDLLARRLECERKHILPIFQEKNGPPIVVTSSIEEACNRRGQGYRDVVDIVQDMCIRANKDGSEIVIMLMSQGSESMLVRKLNFPKGTRWMKHVRTGHVLPINHDVMRDEDWWAEVLDSEIRHMEIARPIR